MFIVFWSEFVQLLEFNFAVKLSAASSLPLQMKNKPLKVFIQDNVLFVFCISQHVQYL